MEGKWRQRLSECLLEGVCSLDVNTGDKGYSQPVLGLN